MTKLRRYCFLSINLGYVEVIDVIDVIDVRVCPVYTIVLWITNVTLLRVGRNTDIIISAHIWAYERVQYTRIWTESYLQHSV